MNKFSRIFNIFVVLVMLLVAVGIYPQTAQAQISKDEVSPDAQFIPGEVVVGFKSSVANLVVAQAATMAGTVGAMVVNQNGNLALLSFDENADVLALSEQLGGMEGVAFAEPNYIFNIPETFTTDNTRPEAPTSVTRTGKDGTSVEVSIADLRAMRTIKNGSIVLAYPNDPYLFYNWGWSYIGADIVSSNLTPSAGVCELDTGVDYLHPDLTGHIIKGYDFVNNDADPMDDNGHGTHVAGVITAASNNGKGIAGVAFNAKVVAVKVLNAQGSGTNYSVAVGINYCANRPDVKVLNMSLGGGAASVSVFNAVNYAVNTKNKLLVAAAGNSGSSTPIYPAGWSTAFPDKVLAVGAIDNGATTSYGCRASYSNYGSWISVAAPGTDILSTMPYDKPFYMNYMWGYYQRYDYLSGTSMATPFVSAAAARAWGYLPAAHPKVLPDVWANDDIGNAVRLGSYSTVTANGTCWPATMAGIHILNVAYLLERGAAYAYIGNSTTALPLPGATFQVYKNNVLVGSGLTSTTNPGGSLVEVLNLPMGATYVGKVNKTGFTNGSQPAFQHTSYNMNGSNHNYVYASLWTYFGAAYIPPRSSNIDVVAGWGDNISAVSGDLDLYVWLPDVPNLLDPGQPSEFAVGDYDGGHPYGFLEGDPTGTLLAHPFAIFNREGGRLDPLLTESVTISSRKAHPPLAANTALPYYASSAANPYWVELWDHDIDYSTSSTTIYATWPWAYVWKDGVIKGFAEDTEGCNQHQWWPFKIYGGVGGAINVVQVEGCGIGFYPYVIDFGTDFVPPEGRPTSP